MSKLNNPIVNNMLKIIPKVYDAHPGMARVVEYFIYTTKVAHKIRIKRIMKFILRIRIIIDSIYTDNELKP